MTKTPTSLIRTIHQTSLPKSAASGPARAQDHRVHAFAPLGEDRARRAGREPDHRTRGDAEACGARSSPASSWAARPPVGQVGDRRRQRDRAPVGADRDRVAVGHAERVGGRPCRSGPPAGGRCRPAPRRRRAATRGRSAGARWPAPPRPRPAAGSARGATRVGAAGRLGPASAGSAPSSRRIVVTSPVPSATPISAAIASSTRPSVIAVVVQHRVEGAQPALPVHERAGLLRRRRDRAAPRRPGGSPRSAAAPG